MQFQTKRTQLRIDWLMLLFPIIASVLGQGREAAMLFLSLTAHEAAHLLTARALNLSIRSLRLTPFGGMSQIENPYSISALKLIAVSAAGPAANLLMMLLAASLGYWRWIAPALAAQVIRINLLLMLFNLLPALPLDGGRILYALLARILPRRRAAEVGIFSGRLLAAVLLIFAVWGCIRRGTLNLSPIFAALFLIVSAEDERRALTDSRLRSLISALKPLSKPQPVGIIAIDSATPPEVALRSAVPGKLTLFAVYRDGRFDGFIDDRILVARMVSGKNE